MLTPESTSVKKHIAAFCAVRVLKCEINQAGLNNVICSNFGISDESARCSDTGSWNLEEQWWVLVDPCFYLVNIPAAVHLGLGLIFLEICKNELVFYQNVWGFFSVIFLNTIACVSEIWEATAGVRLRLLESLGVMLEAMWKSISLWG